jgi:hypothetical protein
MDETRVGRERDFGLGRKAIGETVWEGWNVGRSLDADHAVSGRLHRGQFQRRSYVKSI